MIRRVIAAATLAMCTCATAAACGSDKGPQANAPAIAWSEQVCKAIDAGAAKLSQLPAVDPSNPQAAKDSLVVYLGSLSDALGGVSEGLKTAGTPPVTDGQAALDKAMTTVTTTRSTVDTAKTKLQAAPVTDTVTFQAAISDISKVMSQLTDNEGPAKDLKSNPELATAFASAATCQRVEGA
ncbi:hypothetical protein [Alloactinosynnema sp. L-07]|uniref:hypothetical protein n=1 Tax=Alloactinosynnema sp. L-07 TaxID=1653480 RepID=UPI00065F05C1|nr:hypothetical protein [Alloactinosynnema sp. L-07]CRK57216.1 hypothetical protein [Alloactinosynnema sp. L-07]